MHEFLEESFDLENTYEYILSIQVSLNGFSFSVLYPNNNSVLAFKYTPLKISNTGLIARRFKDWYTSEEVLHKAFQQTRLIVFSDKFTLLPENLSNESAKEEITHILFQNGSKLKFAENIVEPLKARLLFSLPEGLMPVVSETIGECEIIHPLKSMINATLSNKNHPDELTLLFNDKELYLLIKKQKLIQLANTFKINHCNDAVYFVLTTLNQMGISPKEFVMNYAGVSPFKEETAKSLHNHFAHQNQ